MRTFVLKDQHDGTDRVRVKDLRDMDTKAGDYSGVFHIQIGNSHMALLNKSASRELRDQLNEFLEV